jgi:hypothetical protein
MARRRRSTRRRSIRRVRKNPADLGLWLALLAGAGVVGLLIYGHVAKASPAAPATPGTTPQLPLGTTPATPDQPAPNPTEPQGLTADGHTPINIYEISDEAQWTVLDRDTLAASPNPGFPGSLIITDTPAFFDPNNIANRGTGITWLTAMLNAGHRVFVAPAMFSTTPNARFVALDTAPAAYQEVLVSA